MYVCTANTDLIQKKVTLHITSLLEKLLQTCQMTGFAQNVQLLELKHSLQKKNRTSSSTKLFLIIVRFK